MLDEDGETRLQYADVGRVSQRKLGVWQTCDTYIARACSRRSRLSRSVFAHGPRQPSSLLKLGVGEIGAEIL